MEGSDEPQASSSSSSSGSSNNEPSTHDQSVDHDVETSEQINTSSSEMDDAEDMEIEGELSGSITEVEGEGESGNMEVHLDDPSEPVDEMQMEAGPSNPGKRVKVYELRDSSWFDRGTGHCKGVYDDTQDLALLIVEAEDMNEGKEEAATDGEGGFLKEELLLSTRVEKDDIYARQQETLIVWTEPTTQMDIALSFQDSDGCEDIWSFISEVQRHLNNLPSDADPGASSPRLSASPPMGLVMSRRAGSGWQQPSLANVREQQVFVNMQSKSQMGRDKIIEHIINEDWLKHLIGVFDQAEDLESLEDIHAVSNIVHILFTLNDNTVLEYLLQDDVFMGILGVLEYDAELPSHRAPYRQHYTNIAKYREVVPIRDPGIQNKIHQTYRLHYLREVVLSRMLDEGTFGILNGIIFFNQVDIINHVQNNDPLLVELLSPFKGQTASAEPDNTPLDEKKRDALLFLHQLLILSKPVQMAGRLALYRGLIDRGLLYVIEWAFRRKEDQILHTASEILTFTLEHDTNAVRNHILKEEDAKTTTLLAEMTGIQASTENIGLASHLSDSIRSLLDVPSETESFTQRKEGPMAENFMNFFYETPVHLLFKPITELPNFESGPPPKLPRHRISLCIMLIELLSFCVLHHAHRASYFILSNPISKKVFSLLRVKDKPLRYAVLRYARTCFRTPNHFIHRYFVKQDLIPPLLELLEEESTRDNMLSSSCMDVLTAIRTENIKPILNYMFEHYRSRIEAIGRRPFLRAGIQALTSKWEQNNEPPPAPPQIESEASQTPWKREAQEEDYFNASDDDETPEQQHRQSHPLKKAKDAWFGNLSKRNTSLMSKSKKLDHSRSARAADSSGRRSRLNAMANKSPGGGGKSSPSTPNSKANVNADATKSTSAEEKPSLGLDYDDGSDSDTSSNGNQSPRTTQSAPLADPKNPNPNTEVTEALEEDLMDVTMKMRAKRQREEEDDADFAGLFGSLSKGKAQAQSEDTQKLSPEVSTTALDESARAESDAATATSPSATTATSIEKDKETEGGAGATGKRLKLNFGFGRKSK